VNGTEARETLRKSTKTINGIEERRVTVLTKRVNVKLDLLQGFLSRSLKIVIIVVESDCMTQEINSVVLKLKLLENISHGLLLNINILPCLGIIEVNILAIDVEITASFFLEKTHQR
jgi:hypothetical protein